MSVNLVKYREQILRAWEDVLNDKTACNWAVFGYEKQTNDLQVVSMGDGGLDELAEEFNGGKIMYALCRVIDPNTGLTKFVFINWQGEGAPMSRKGACANHVIDITRFFKGTHITINARADEDVDPEAILEEVTKASASKFNFKERSNPVENIAPVSSVYKRIQPIREINPIEREQFWEKEQEEEKQRVKEERRKSVDERKRLEKERREREILEAQAREKAAKEQARHINQMKEAERRSQNTSQLHEQEKLEWEKQLKNDAKEEVEKRTRSESLRKERNQEAKSLIAQRTINARAIFEQNTCAGQLSSIQNSKQTVDIQAVSPTKSEEEHKINDASTILCSPSQKENATHDSSLHGFSYNRNLLNENLLPTQDADTEAVTEEQNWDEPTLESPPNAQDHLAKILTEQGMVKSTPNASKVIMSSQATECLSARALYDYQAADDTEISFDPDDVITEIEQIDEGWWQGQAPDGTYGLFPANYVELLD